MTPRSLTLAAAATLLTSGLAVAPALTSPASAAPTHGDKRVCAAAPTGYAACHARVRTLVTPDGKARPDATAGPTGYSPAQLAAAYGLTGISGSTTIAIVDAYAHPNPLGDLNTYRNTFGLGNANFTEYGQGGGARSATGNTGWGQEQMLDLEMVSAICPTCPIIYVGANSASFADLGAAVNTAVAKGAKVVSNSYGGSEYSGEASVQSSYYTHPGVAQTVSSGDNGYGVEIPAAFNTVTAVGGTTLRTASNARGWTETTWSGAGSGCSGVISKPSWQHDGGCSRRTVADVSAVADPNTGVSVYDTYGSAAGTPWYVFGGTSVAAPIIAGVYGLAGSGTWSTTTAAASVPYAHTSSLNDVTSGSNTRRCRSGYLCTAVSGYDGPTGLGTPSGVGAF
jgi:subtilase family serine protease